MRDEAQRALSIVAPAIDVIVAKLEPVAGEANLPSAWGERDLPPGGVP